MLNHIKSHRARVYAGMILALDRGVETILTAVEAIGETDNTIVIFTSDNGGADYVGRACDILFSGLFTNRYC
jgi:arylsulfatase A-like enzyme